METTFVLNQTKTSEKQSIKYTLIHNKGKQKNLLVKDLISNYSTQEVLESIIKTYEDTKETYYLSLVFFFPNQWLKSEVNKDSYYMRLVRYGYFYKKSLSLKSFSFYEDNINADVISNMQLLTSYHLTKQPLILGDNVIDLGNAKEPKMIDLIEDKVIFNYNLLNQHQSDILNYFHKLNDYKFKNIVSQGKIHSKWSFVRKIKNDDTWNSMIFELKELYDIDNPVTRLPYKLKDSVVTFLSTENRTVEYIYEKDISLPKEVIQNPSRIRTHLISLANWHFKRKFKYVSFSFPHMDIELFATNITTMKKSIFKLLPYVNQNILKSILSFSQKLTYIRGLYPNEYINLELNNHLTYDALRVLDYHNFAQLHTEILRLKQETENNSQYQSYTFNFLGNTMQYDAFSRFYYKILNRFDRRKNLYYLTTKAVNSSCAKGFHYATSISLMLDYLFEMLPTEDFLIFRSKISKMVKNECSILEIISFIEDDVSNNEYLYDIFYNIQGHNEEDSSEDIEEELPF